MVSLKCAGVLFRPVPASRGPGRSFRSQRVAPTVSWSAEQAIGDWLND